MSLRELFENTYLPMRLLGKSPNTIIAYRVALRHWARSPDHVPVDAITDVVMARFAAWHFQTTSPATVNKTLRHLRAVIRLAVRQKLLAEMPEMPHLPEGTSEPEAYLHEEIVRIIQAAWAMPSPRIEGIDARDWWVSLLFTIYDSGGRIGAVIATQTADLSLDDGTILLRPEHQKQRRGQRLRLSEETIAACRPVWRADRIEMWPWPFRREALYRHFRKILVAADVATGVGTGCLFHRLRKSTASYLKAAGGNPTAQLGHSTTAVTARYLDPRICGESQAADLIPRLGITFA